MESYNKLTDTELLYQINDSKKWHEAIKKETIGLTLQIEEIEKIVNEKAGEELLKWEKNQLGSKAFHGIYN